MDWKFCVRKDTGRQIFYLVFRTLPTGRLVLLVQKCSDLKASAFRNESEFGLSACVTKKAKAGDMAAKARAFLKQNCAKKSAKVGRCREYSDPKVKFSV